MPSENWGENLQDPGKFEKEKNQCPACHSFFEGDFCENKECEMFMSEAEKTEPAQESSMELKNPLTEFENSEVEVIDPETTPQEELDDLWKQYLEEAHN